MPDTMTPAPASPDSTSPLYITQITLPSGNTYELVDKNARITITSVSSNINSISSNINSVSSTVNSLSSTVNSLSSTINGLSNATQFLGIGAVYAQIKERKLQSAEEQYLILNYIDYFLK